MKLFNFYLSILLTSVFSGQIKHFREFTEASDSWFETRKSSEKLRGPPEFGISGPAGEFSCDEAKHTMRRVCVPLYQGKQCVLRPRSRAVAGHVVFV